MINSPQKLIITFLNKAKHENCYQRALTKAVVDYQLKPYNILKLNPQQTFQIYIQIQKKFYSESQLSDLDSWAQNELRIFVWFVIVYAFVEQKRIEEFNQFDWNILSLIFYGKSPVTLQFQSLCLMRHKRFKKWSQQEIKLLSESISQREQKNRWNQIAKQIFIKSNKKYFRTPKQCREQWFNHLDPTKIKSQWTLIEDYLLIKSIINNGRKWSRVAKEIGNHRTEHMVKNRFKSLINMQMKRLIDVDRQQLLITKIKQRLQSNNLVKRYIQEQHEKQSKKQSNIASQQIQKTKQKSLLSQTVTCLQQFSLQNILQIKNNKQVNNNIIEQNIKCQQNGKDNQQSWILKQQAEIDQLDIQQLFNSERIQICYPCKQQKS